ncbi:MAG: hypothetical protein AAB956_01310, partial [Patescibacteria group bacterium]
MNFFLEGTLAGKNFFNLLGNQTAMVGNSIGNTFYVDSGVELLIKTLALIWFGLLGSIFFLLYALLFILRYIAIWTLVILSPIAFWCYILPATKKIWTMWWNQFIQWCFIGVLAAFFLYLTDQLLAIENTIAAPINREYWSAMPSFAAMMNTLLPYGVAFTLLIVGFFTALSTSAMGAGGIIKTAQGGARKAQSWAMKTTKAKAWDWAAPRAKEKAERQMERLAGFGRPMPELAAVGRWRDRPLQRLRATAASVASAPVRVMGRLGKEAVAKLPEREKPKPGEAAIDEAGKQIQGQFNVDRRQAERRAAARNLAATRLG